MKHLLVAVSIGKFLKVGTKYKLQKKEGERPPSRDYSPPWQGGDKGVGRCVIIMLCLMIKYLTEADSTQQKGECYAIMADKEGMFEI